MTLELNTTASENRYEQDIIQITFKMSMMAWVWSKLNFLLILKLNGITKM
jgi:hypothetical protein